MAISRAPPGHEEIGDHRRLAGARVRCNQRNWTREIRLQSFSQPATVAAAATLCVGKKCGEHSRTRHATVWAFFVPTLLCESLAACRVCDLAQIITAKDLESFNPPRGSAGILQIQPTRTPAACFNHTRFRVGYSKYFRVLWRVGGISTIPTLPRGEI